jgi:hypothetical protein
MKYLCLCYCGARDAAASAAYDAELHGRGSVVAAAWLGPAEDAATLRVRNGSLAVDEGPCEAGAGALAAVALIEARDLNEAIRVAAELPAARSGSVEVRPVRELQP